MEVELLSSAIQKIVNQEVLETEVISALPKIDELKDSNNTYRGKVSVLFVDMRESTHLPERYNSDQLVKIYRSYIRVVVQSVRYSGGVVRDFMGDGVLALFVDDEEGSSADKAVRAARYITTAIDKFLNPVLDNIMNYRLSCGIGIDTGEVYLSKVGMRGKEFDNNSESEFGIAWIGSCTNLACKQSGAVECGTIFISNSTFVELSEESKQGKWKSTVLIKGENILKGYIAEKHYLLLDEDLKSIVAPARGYQKSFADFFSEKLDEIVKKSETLGEIKQQLDEKNKQLELKDQALKNKESKLNTAQYRFYCKVLDSGHCRKVFVREMGQSFWDENLQNAIISGTAFGKTEREVKQEVSYAMVSIYEALNLYDKAYDFLVEQALGYSWLSINTVKNIVSKVKYSYRLKWAICERLEKGDLSTEDQMEFENIKNWLLAG